MAAGKLCSQEWLWEASMRCSHFPFVTDGTWVLLPDVQQNQSTDSGWVVENKVPNTVCTVFTVGHQGAARAQQTFRQGFFVVCFLFFQARAFLKGALGVRVAGCVIG